MPIGTDPTIEFITPNELARLLKISKAGVYRLVDKRQIPFHKVMGSLRFSIADIESFLLNNRIEPIGLQHYGSKKN
jgi:excisionase family DNA binding protein